MIDAGYRKLAYHAARHVCAIRNDDSAKEVKVGPWMRVRTISSTDHHVELVYLMSGLLMGAVCDDVDGLSDTLYLPRDTRDAWKVRGLMKRHGISDDEALNIQRDVLSHLQAEGPLIAEIVRGWAKTATEFGDLIDDLRDES